MFHKPPNFFSFTLKNGKTINVDKGAFNGNIEEARTRIQDFCSNNDIHLAILRGYGNLTINGKVHPITPYGIDLNMMIEYCLLKKESLSHCIG